MMSYAEPGKCCGTKELTDHLKSRFGIEVGETSDDKRFTLVELECLGACGTAPVVGVNDVLFENVTPQMLDEIIEKLPKDPHDFKDPTIDWDEGH